MDGQRVKKKSPHRFTRRQSEIMKTRVLGLAAPALLLAVAASGQTISTTVRHSDSGLGAIDYNPNPSGTVDQYVILGDANSPSPALSTAVSGDGTLVSGQYEPTYFVWTGGASGTPGGVSGSTYNATIYNVEAISSGYGSTPWTSASISLTAPSTAFKVDFFVHDFYANAGLDVLLNGHALGSYSSIMSSSGSRSTDFLFTEQLSGVTQGDTLTFKFDGLQNLGSTYANIAIYAADVNLTLPPALNDLTPTVLPNEVPEPSTLALAAMGALSLFLLRRRQ
jgi:hypothetical protein